VQKWNKSCANFWTIEAINCYKSGCYCSKCETIKHIESSDKESCPMKYIVRELVKKFGAPDDDTITRLRGRREHEEWIT